MTREEVLKKIIEISAEHFRLPVEEFSEKTNFVEDLDADSLDAAEMVLILEEEYGFDRISDSDFMNMTSVKNIVDYVMDQLKEMEKMAQMSEEELTEYKKQIFKKEKKEFEEDKKKNFKTVSDILKKTQENETE